jgi:hypothetical protein
MSPGSITHRLAENHQIPRELRGVIRHLQWFDIVVFSPRTLFNIFFKSTGLVLIRYVERGKTIDHQYCIDYCLKPLINNIKKQRPSCGVQGIKLHHDNGRPHVHQAVLNYLESEGG